MAGAHPILSHVAEERELVARVRAWLEERERTLDEIEQAAARLEPVRFDLGHPAEPVPKAESHRNGRQPEKLERARLPGLPPPSRTQVQRRPPAAQRTAPAARPLQTVTQRRLRILEFVTQREPVKAAEIRREIGLSPPQLRDDLTALRQEGHIQMVGKTASARWWLTSTLDQQVAKQNGNKGRVGAALGHRRSQARSLVLAVVGKESGCWSEQRIADDSSYNREEIADACGELLDDGLIELQADGTYCAPSAALADSA